MNAKTIVLVLLVLFQATFSQSTETDPANKHVSYYSDILPLFQSKCHGCHQPAKASGEYVMTSFSQLLKGGESGEAAIKPTDVDSSYLLELITPNSAGEFEMPKGKDPQPLQETEIALIRRWISAGATDDTPDNARQLYTADSPPRYSLPPVVSSLEYSPNGELLAVTGFHEVLLHNTDGSGLVARLVGLSERVESLAFSPDGKKLAVTGGLPGRLGEVQIWDIEKRNLERSFAVTFDTTYGASWSPDGYLVAVGCSDKSVRVINIASGEEVVYMAAHADWVRDTVFSANGKSLFSVSRDQTVKMTDVGTERFVGNVTTHTPGILRGGMNAVDRHPKLNQLLAGGADGAPKLFKMEVKAAPAGGGNPNQIREFGRMPGRVFDVCFGPEGKKAFAGSSLNGKGQVRAYDASSAKELWKLDVPESGIFALAASPDGKTIAAAGADGFVRLIDAEKGAQVNKFSPVEIVTEVNESASIAAAELITPKLETTETLPQGFSVASVSIHPDSVDIKQPTDYAQLLLTVGLSGGASADGTRLAKWTVEGGVGSISERGLFTPSKNGAGKIIAEVDGHRTEIAVNVAEVHAKFTPDFVRDVAPVISKLGCNAGTCHGSKDGKNGFKLSLRGYDPIFDVRAFTDDMASRRANVASPGKSLMLLKATGAVPHEGGEVAPHNSKYYQIIRDWIGTGAKLDTETPRVTSIEIHPTNPVVQQIGQSQQMRVVATFADGLRRDVTREAYIDSGDSEIALHDSIGLITSVRRGEAPVLARYEGHYAATTLTVMGDRQGFAWRDQPANNELDRLVAAKWKRMKILPSPLCTDDEFIRRVYLDLIGLPPTAEEFRKFVKDNRESSIKRDELVDQLIGSEDYVDHWTNKWADLLQVNRKFLGVQGAKPFRDWIRNEVAMNTSYNDFVAKILTATGSNKENPAASYFKILRTPVDTMENTTHLFLATRFNCNKCHDHPFERWTQNQYYEMAAYFAQFKLDKDPASGKNQIGGTAVEGKKPLYEIVTDMDKGDVKHERTGQVTPPSFPYSAAYEVNEDATRREHLAAWITSPDNQYFARSYVNRIWGYLFGIGIIDPIDDIRAGNPPTNPELLNWLTAEFVQGGFDVQEVFRLICKSRVYQLSVATNEWNEDDTINFSHATARRLPAEVLLDSIYRVTGTQSRFPGVPVGTRAAGLPDSGVKLPDGFLGKAGRPARESACECERSTGLQLGPVMALVSGPTVNDAISNAENDISKFARSEMDDRALVEELFIQILNRPGTEGEITAGLRVFSEEINRDHDSIVKVFTEYEASVAERTKAREKAHHDKVVAARAEVAEYEKKIAPREAELDLQQKQRIAKANASLKAFDEKIDERQNNWEAKYILGESDWTILDPREMTSSFGATFEKQEDLSVLVTGKNGKGTYEVTADTNLEGITGVRLELLADDRLPKKGPGRGASNGNYVLTEFELTASPLQDLKQWQLAKEWDFGSKESGWTARDGANVSIVDGATTVSSPKVNSQIRPGPWYSVGPFFDGDAFNKPLGPEGKPIVLTEQFTAGDKKLNWTRRPDVRDGNVLSFSPGEFCANYFFRAITCETDRSLALRFGSDDGIKVFLNAKQVLANDVGRGAAVDQESVTVNLKKGENQLLVKIHNRSGPSGFYFDSDAEAAIMPSIVSKIPSPKGSYVLELVARADKPQSTHLFWKTEAKNSFAGKRVTPLIEIAAGDWKTYRYSFVSMTGLIGLRFDPGAGPTMIKSAKLYRHEIPTKVVFQNAQADFSQKGYDVTTAIDGKVEPTGNGWAGAPKLGENRYASFETKQDLSLSGGATLRFVMNQQYTDSKHSIGRFRLSVTCEPRPVSFGLPEEITGILDLATDKRTDGQQKKLADFYKTRDSERIELVASLADAKKPRMTDPKLKKLKDELIATENQKPPRDEKLARMRRDVELSKKQLADKRVTAAQDIAWALINSPAFLFNR